MHFGLIMSPLSLMASLSHLSMAKSCRLAKTKTAWISQGNIQSSYFSEFSSNSFWGARTRCAILSERKGPNIKHSPTSRFSSSASQIWQWRFFFWAGWDIRGVAIARHVGIVFNFNFTKRRKGFLGPLGLYLSEFGEGSILIKRYCASTTLLVSSWKEPIGKAQCLRLPDKQVSFA